MKKLIVLLHIFICFFVCHSCNDSWLTPDPLSSLTPENVYIDEAGMRALLITMRKNLKKEAYGQRHPIAGEHAASDLAVPIYQLDFRKLTPNDEEFWKYLSLLTISYGCIKDANVAISRIDNIEFNDESIKNEILAEALWHRGYWYYRLVNSYGDVPWIGEEVQDAKLDYQTYSRWTILEKLQKDLEFAIDWLPDKAPPGAISKGAGYMLLAKVQLANLDYDGAIISTTNIIDGPYKLMRDRFGSSASDPEFNVIWDLHRPDNMNNNQNSETILATVDRYEAPPGAKTAGTYTMRLYHCAASYNALVRDSEGKPGTVDAGGQYDTLGRGNGDVRLNSYYQYDLWSFDAETWDNTSDLRRSDINWIDLHEIYYNRPSSVNYGEPVNPDWFSSKADTFMNYYAMPIYKTYIPQQSGTPSGGNSDWYIFRLAEAYLLRAEANFWNGNLESAKNDINIVRERANATLITTDQVSIDFIFDERARELFAEEPRHSEMVRVSYILAKEELLGYSLNSFSEKNYYYDRVMDKNIFYKQDISYYSNNIFLAPYHVLWPISEKVISANTKGRINQNIGYAGSEKNVDPITDPIN